MSDFMVRIHNLETEEIIDREMTEAEIAKLQIDQEVEKKKRAELAAREAQRQALLDKLGITQEEAKLLLG